MKIEAVRGGALNLDLKQLYSLFPLYGDIEELFVTSGSTAYIKYNNNNQNITSFLGHVFEIADPNFSTTTEYNIRQVFELRPTSPIRRGGPVMMKKSEKDHW